ncbi:MAG: hypothetical protein GY948_24990 [Alphaproteobacteria bacterium]|nr:hypothetical protein [Alphaproteobacteria bacterium]
MKLTKTLTMAALLLGALPALSGAGSPAFAANDPTSGRVEQRQQQIAQQKFERCKKASLRAYNYTVNKANGDAVRIQQASRYYVKNVAGCRTRYL